MFKKNSGNKLFQILSYCSTLLIQVHAMLINEIKRYSILDPIEPLLYTGNFSEWKTRVYCLIFSELIYMYILINLN